MGLYVSISILVKAYIQQAKNKRSAAGYKTQAQIFPKV